MKSGKRYDDEPKLNIKKVVGVIIAIAVVAMIAISIKMLLENGNKIKDIIKVGYFSAYKDNKWGVIDSNGEYVISPEYDEMIIIPDSSKDIFIVTYDVSLENETYKTKIINSKKEQLFKDYETVEAIDNYDVNGNIWYEENVLKVKKDGKFGLINFSGKEILKCEYDSIYSLKGIKNSLIINKSEKTGLTSNVGEIIIEPKYSNIRALSKKYEDGYVVTNAEGKCGIIDSQKKQVLSESYEEIGTAFSSTLFTAKKDGKWKIVDKEDVVVLEDKFDEVLQIAEGNLVVKKGENVGVLTIGGIEKIPFEYQEIKFIFDKYFIAKKGDKYGLVDLENNEKLPFEYISMFNREETDFLEAEVDGVNTKIYNKNLELKLTGIVSEVNTEKGYINIRIENEQKYYNFKFEEKQEKDIFTKKTLFLSKKDGKYGYKNKDGNVVVDYIYDDAKPQNDYGYCSVKKGDNWGCLNKDGNVLIEPNIDLSNNLIVNFIGKWHLDLDLNANYYVQ